MDSPALVTEPDVLERAIIHGERQNRLMDEVDRSRGLLASNFLGGNDA